MSIFSRTPAPRTPHHEPGFNETDYVAEYSEQTRKHAGDEHRAMLDFVARQMAHRESMNLLDIGCGPGWIDISLAQAHPGLRLVGVDVSPQFVALANQNAQLEGVGSQIDFVEGDAGSLGRFADQTFDAVISNQSLHYWDSPSTTFNEIARVLRPGGSFFIADDRRDMTLLGRLQVFLGGRMLSSRIGESWRRSLAGCFSSQEVEQLLQNSALKDRWTMSLRARGLQVTSR